ncbi:MAG: periplasmic heavy metal sensor [Bacteroidetes bacterium]|nr:periplasmic heavy metal sensor [Bacteroidota bacterium]
MKRDTLLTIAIVVLLVLNIGTISYLFISRPHHMPPPPPPPMGERGPMMRPDELIRSTLGLSEAQDKQYAASIETHHSAMMKLDSEFRSAADRYFQMLRGNASQSDKDAALAAIGKAQSGKAEATYKHFEEIRALCTSEQQPKFDSIVPELTRMLLNQQPRGPQGGPMSQGRMMPPPEAGPHGMTQPPPPPPHEGGEQMPPPERRKP